MIDEEMEKEELEFVCFIGAPASGKTTKAEEYRRKAYAVFSSDEVRAKIEAKLASGELVMPSNTDLKSMIFDEIKRETIEALKRGQSVVLDATNLGRRRRMNFRKSLYRIPCVHTCLLFITARDECLRRNALRTGVARVPDEAMYKMFCNFECPNYWEGWDRIIPIADDVPYAFDFAQVVDFTQDNPHHTLTLGGHMDATYRLAVENGFSECVQKCAKYHDIGKFYTKRFENRYGERTETAHFYGHENYSAFLYLTEQCCGKTLTKEEFDKVLYETNLINCHMRPLILWRNNPEMKNKDKKLFGEQFLEDLVALHQCDRAAH